MRSIDVTAHDLRSRSLAAPSLAAALAALREDGIVALLGAVAPDHVRRLRERLAEDLERVLARGAETPFNWNAGNIQQSPPRDPEWIFADVLMNDQAVAVTRALL